MKYRDIAEHTLDKFVHVRESLYRVYDRDLRFWALEKAHELDSLSFKARNEFTYSSRKMA